VGAGGGFLIVPALALWSGLPMTAAVGTSLLIIASNSGAGFLGYLDHVEVDYALVAIVSAMAIVGSFLGSRLATVVEPSSLRRAFAGFVMTMAVFILVREGALVLSTFGSALPTTWPQVVFAFVMLGVGILAGRHSKDAADANPEFDFNHGAGI